MLKSNNDVTCAGCHLHSRHDQKWTSSSKGSRAVPEHLHFKITTFRCWTLMSYWDLQSPGQEWGVQTSEQSLNMDLMKNFSFLPNLKHPNLMNENEIRGF